MIKYLMVSAAILSGVALGNINNNTTSYNTPVVAAAAETTKVGGITTTTIGETENVISNEKFYYNVASLGDIATTTVTRTSDSKEFTAKLKWNYLKITNNTIDGTTQSATVNTSITITLESEDETLVFNSGNKSYSYSSTTGYFESNRTLGLNGSIRFGEEGYVYPNVSIFSEDGVSSTMFYASFKLNDTTNKYSLNDFTGTFDLEYKSLGIGPSFYTTEELNVGPTIVGPDKQEIDYSRHLTTQSILNQYTATDNLDIGNRGVYFKDSSAYEEAVDKQAYGTYNVTIASEDTDGNETTKVVPVTLKKVDYESEYPGLKLGEKNTILNEEFKLWEDNTKHVKLIGDVTRKTDSKVFSPYIDINYARVFNWGFDETYNKYTGDLELSFNYYLESDDEIINFGNQIVSKKKGTSQIDNFSIESNLFIQFSQYVLYFINNYDPSSATSYNYLECYSTYLLTDVTGEYSLADDFDVTNVGYTAEYFVEAGDMVFFTEDDYKEGPTIVGPDKLESKFNQSLTREDILVQYTATDNIDLGNQVVTLKKDSGYFNALDSKKFGKYKLTLSATDSDGNESEKVVEIELIDDSEEYLPVVEGPRKIYKSNNILLTIDDIKELYSAKSFDGENLDVNVRNVSYVNNANKVGSYKVKVEATDSEDRTRELPVTIEVLDGCSDMWYLDPTGIHTTQYSALTIEQIMHEYEWYSGNEIFYYEVLDDTYSEMSDVPGTYNIEVEITNFEKQYVEEITIHVDEAATLVTAAEQNFLYWLGRFFDWLWNDIILFFC